MNLLEVRSNPQVRPDYRIEIKNDGDTMMVSFGCLWGEPPCRLRHPNIAVSRLQRYEFKHYQSIRGKWWTSKIGLTHYAFFRLADLSLADLSQPGYSYIKLATPGGEKLTLSVSGGTGGGVWTDWLHASASSFVGIPAARLSRILDAAVPAPGPLSISELDEQEIAGIRRGLYAKQAMALRPLPRLWLNPGLNVRGGNLTENELEGGLPVQNDNRKRRRFTCEPFLHYQITVRHSQVDWAKTGERLGLTIPGFDRCGRLLDPSTECAAPAGVQGD